MKLQNITVTFVVQIPEMEFDKDLPLPINKDKIITHAKEVVKYTDIDNLVAGVKIECPEYQLIEFDSISDKV